MSEITDFWIQFTSKYNVYKRGMFLTSSFGFQGFIVVRGNGQSVPIYFSVFKIIIF